MVTNRTKHFLLLIVMVIIGSFLPKHAVAYEERNLLQQLADESRLRDILLMKQQWVPYPSYADREGWETLLGENRERLIISGEKLLDYKWKLVPATAYLEFERSGDRNVMQNPYDANLKALNTLMLAELAEGKGRFIDQLIDGVFMSCEMTSWVLSAHLPYQSTHRSLPDFREQVIDISSGGYGALLAWIHYFFHASFDKIDPVISLRISQVIKDRILDPYMDNDRMWWMAFHWKSGQVINNWNPWCNSNVLQCFLLMENDRDRLAKAVYRTMQSVDRFLNFVKADGACEEGPSYWSHAAGKLFDYLQMLSEGTNGELSLFHEPMIQRMGEYISRSYIGDGWVVNFADASAKGGGDPSLIYRYGKAVKSSEMIHFAAYLLGGKKPFPTMGNDVFRSLQSLLVCNELSGITPKHDVPDVTWYPDTEFCYMANKSEMFFAAKGGFNNESHNHNDVGTFSLYIKNLPMFIDAGVGTYTKKTFSSERYTIWTMQSDYHNLPLINGVSQRFGQQYKATSTACHEQQQKFSVDISKAYPAEAKVESWIRSYQLGKNKLTICDRYKLKETLNSNCVNFMTWGKVTKPALGEIIIEVKGQKARLKYPTQFEVKVDTVRLEDSRLSRVWGKEIYRISLKDSKQKIKGEYKFVVEKI